MNDFHEPFLDFFGIWSTDSMLGMISLDGTCVPYAAGFSGLLFFAHVAKFTRITPKFLLDRLLMCLTCERCHKGASPDELIATLTPLLRKE